MTYLTQRDMLPLSLPAAHCSLGETEEVPQSRYRFSMFEIQLKTLKVQKQMQHLGQLEIILF